MTTKVRISWIGHREKWSLILLAVLVPGCVMVPYGTTPQADMTGLKPVALQERKNISFERKVDMIVPGLADKEMVRQYWGAFDDRAMRNAARRHPQVGILEEMAASAVRESDIVLRIECRYTQDVGGAFLTGLTLLIVPFPCYNSWQYDFTVRDSSGRVAQYHFEDGWREHVGWLTIFFVLQYDQSYDKVAEKVLGNVYDQLFLAMARDGFFDPTPNREFAAKKTNAAEKKASVSDAPSAADAGKHSFSDRLKDLESLKSAGVISEEEYRREAERLKTGGGK